MRSPSTVRALTRGIGGGGRRSVDCVDRATGRSPSPYIPISPSPSPNQPIQPYHHTYPTPIPPTNPPQTNTAPSFGDKLKAGLAKVAAPALVGASAFVAPSISHALTKDELSSLSYLQVKGTGLANRCPEVR